MLVEENLVEFLRHFLVHVEGWTGVAVVEAVSELCLHRVCWSRKEHGFGNI